MTSRALPWIATGLVAGLVLVQVAQITSAPTPAPVVNAAAASATPEPDRVRDMTTTLAPTEHEPTRSELGVPARKPTAARADSRDERVRTFTFELTVLDSDDQPLPGAAVYLAPIAMPLDAVGWTDARGRLRVQWRAERETQRIAFAAQHPRHGSSALELVEITPRPYAAAIELRAQRKSPSLSEREDGFTSFARSGAFPAAESKPLDARWSFADARRARFDERGFLHFTDPIDALPGERLAAPTRWSLPPDAPVMQRGGDGEDNVAFLRGVVREPDGSLVPDARVRASDPARNIEISTRSLEDGGFGLVSPTRGVHVSIGGGDLGRYETDLGASSIALQVLHPTLQRGREFAGTLSGPDGESLARWKLALADSSGTPPWADVTWTDDRGRFAIANAPATMLRVDAFAPGADDAFPASSQRGVWADGEKTLRSEFGVHDHAALALRLVDERGVSLDDAEVRILTERADHAARIPFDGALDGYHLDHLTPGRYRLAIFRPGERALTWPTGSRAIELASGDDLDLGPLLVGSKETLVVDAPTGLGAVECTLERREDALDLYLGAFRVRGRWSVDLAPGRYVVTTRAAGAERKTVFDVVGGRTRILRLDPR